MVWYVATSAQMHPNTGTLADKKTSKALKCHFSGFLKAARGLKCQYSALVYNDLYIELEKLQCLKYIDSDTVTDNVNYTGSCKIQYHLNVIHRLFKALQDELKSVLFLRL